MSKDEFFLPQKAGQRKIQLVIDTGVYDELEKIANKNKLKITEVVRQMICFALERTKEPAHD